MFLQATVQLLYVSAGKCPTPVCFVAGLPAETCSNFDTCHDLYFIKCYIDSNKMHGVNNLNTEL